MNASNRKHGIAIILVVMALVFTGCQPAPQKQPAATQPPTTIKQPTATTRPTDIPQPTATTAPTSTPTPQPTATPTVAPTEIVITEGEANCPLEDFEEKSGPKVNDPELGVIYRGFVQKWSFTCQVPYIKGKYVAIADFTSFNGDAFSMTALAEGVTDEGGVWKGTYEWVQKPQFVYTRPFDVNQFISVGTYTGEGKYKGLRLSNEYDISTSMMKYRVTKPASIEQPTATPTIVPAEMVVAEREANCLIEDFKEEAPLAILNDPELGKVDRAFVIRHNFACSEPYIKGKIISIQDGHFMKDDTYTWSGISEIITDEGGVWKGTYEVIHGISLGTSKGDGKYKGLLVSVEYDLGTSDIKIRVTKLVEDPVQLTFAGMLIGNWGPLSKSADAMFLQFNPDGMCRQASSLDGLTNVPQVECTYTFEGTNLAMTAVTLHGVPACPSPTGKYEVWQVVDNQIRLDAVEDTCAPRRNSTIGVYQRIP